MMSLQVYELMMQEDGTLALPTELLEKLDLQPGDKLRVIETSEGFFIPLRLGVPGIVRDFQKATDESGVTLGDLLQALKADRAATAEVRYAANPST
ncbi:MAG: AbrB/MazE/SpoVT family DNA-binding domain-containing protein [bacterium]|nr:AbrB/MazE/SpoVT family DNA-binding domain-containing protein [bacterium]